MVKRPGAGMEDDLTNTELLRFLQDKVLTRLASIDTRLATMNGSIAQNARDIATNSARVQAQEIVLQQSCVEIAVLQERDAHQKERLAETKSDVKALWAKVFDIAMKVSGIVTAIALITKLANVW